jgi:G3E family GTPase
MYPPPHVTCILLLFMSHIQARQWEADATDARTVAHLLCDQIEFANVLIINKVSIVHAGGAGFLFFLGIFF